MAEKSLAHQTVIGAGWMMAWRFMTRSLGVVSTLVLARVLVPEDFGLIAMASIFAGVIDAMSQIGLQDALVRHPADDRKLFDTAFTLQLLRALIVGLLMAAIAPLAAWWFTEPRLTAVVLTLAALAALGGLENIGIVEFRRAMRFDKQFLINAMPRMLQVIVSITAALLLHSYWALMIGIAVGRVARLATTYIAHPYRPGLTLEGWRELAGFSFWTWATSMVNLVWERSDTFILGPVIGSRGLGLFLLAFETATLPVTELIAPASEALFAGFASAQKRGGGAGPSASAVAVTLLLCVAPLTIAVSASAGYVVTVLMGAQWAAAQPLVAILAWQCLFAPFGWVCSSMLLARGLVRLNFIGNLAAALIRLCAMLVLVRFTQDLTMICALITIVVAAEASIFMLMLRQAGDTGLRAARGALARMLLAGLFSLALLHLAGLGWNQVNEPALLALWHGALVGMVAVGSFLLVDFGLWAAIGRPAGPEARLIELLARFLPPRWRRALGGVE